MLPATMLLLTFVASHTCTFLLLFGNKEHKGHEGDTKNTKLPTS